MKKKNTFYKGVGVFILVLIIFLIGANFYLSKKIHTTITSKLHENGFSFKGNSSLNILFGDLKLKDIQITKDSVAFSSKSIHVNGVSYIDLIKNNKISINSLEIDSPNLIGIISDSIFQFKKVKKDSLKKKKIFSVKSVRIKNASLKIKDSKLEKSSFDTANIELDDFVFGKQMDTGFPFGYSNIQIDIEGLQKHLSEVQALKVGRILLNNDQLTIDNLAILPLKSKERYIYHVKEEKELMQLNIAHIVANKIAFSKKDSLFVKLDSLNVLEADFDMYLDKTRFKKSIKHKDLYSKKLRELPFILNIAKINILNSKLEYEELTSKEKKPGVLIFNDLQATISNIDNRKNVKTAVNLNLKTNFMGNSPLHVLYDFNIQNLQDEFRIRGNLKNVTSKNMSSYISPAMNVKMEGFINRIDFDFEGNNSISNGKFDIKFENFKVTVLNKERKINKFLSWVANLVVKDTSKHGLIVVEVKDVKRNKTKSFWNFFWKNMEKGLQKSLL